MELSRFDLPDDKSPLHSQFYRALGIVELIIAEDRCQRLSEGLQQLLRLWKCSPWEASKWLGCIVCALQRAV